MKKLSILLVLVIILTILTSYYGPEIDEKVSEASEQKASTMDTTVTSTMVPDIPTSITAIPTTASLTTTSTTSSTTSSTSSPTTSSSTSTQNIKVTANELNIRQDKSTDSKIIAEASRGDVFQLLGEAKDAQGRVWYKVEAEFGNVTGWLAGWFCVKTNEDANKGFRSKPGELFDCSSKDLYIKLLLLGNYSTENLIRTFGKDYTVESDYGGYKDYEYKNGVKFRVDKEGKVDKVGVDNRSFYIDWHEIRKVTCDIFSKNKGNEQIITDSGNIIVIDAATKRVIREYNTGYTYINDIQAGNFLGGSAPELYLSTESNIYEEQPAKRGIYKIVNDDFVRVYDEEAFGQYKSGIKAALEKNDLKLDVSIGSFTQSKKSSIPERVFSNTKAVKDKNKLLSTEHAWTVVQEKDRWYVRARYIVNYAMLTYYWGPLLENMDDNETMYNDLARVDVMLDLCSGPEAVYKVDSKVKYDNSKLNSIKPLIYKEAALKEGPALGMTMKEAIAALGGKLKEDYSESQEYKGVSLYEYCGVITDIYTESRDYSTTRGLKVGDSIEKVESLYGKPDIGFSGDEKVQYKFNYKYTKELEATYYRTMTIYYEKGLVKGIQFHQVIFD